MADNLFINEDMRDSVFVYEQAKSLRFLLSRMPMRRNIASQQVKLRPVLEEKLTALPIPKYDTTMKIALGFWDELLSASLIIMWELMKSSWCPSPNAYSILQATQVAQRCSKGVQRDDQSNARLSNQDVHNLF